MSDSLRDQLKQAGFTEKPTKPRPKKKHNSPRNTKRNNSQNAATHKQRSAEADKKQKLDADKAARKAQKAAISEIIEQTQIKKFAGENVYSYTLDKKIRQIHVTTEARTKLISGDWCITRLNGATYLIPSDSGKAIIDINPQWLVVSSTDEDTGTDDYNEFPVPDDIQW